MKGDNIILEKTFQFGLRIVKLHLYLNGKKVDKTLRSLLKDKLADSIIEDCEEILRILTAILNSAKTKIINS